MSEPANPEVDTIGWIDLTVGNAEETKSFYSQVTGWKTSPVSVGDYDDFQMTAPASGQPMAGICHARGTNADLPPVWLVYITVEDVDTSAQICRKLGGKILAAPRNMGEMGRYCVIQDPEGAVAALFASKK